MQQFSNIVIPVDFSINTEIAISKAVAITGGRCSALHLVHISRNSTADKKPTAREIDAELQLKQWQLHAESLMPQGRVYYHLRRGNSVQRGLLEALEQLQADLVIIGKKTNHSLLPLMNTVVPSLISKQAKVAVLTVKPGSMPHRIRNIVVPVSGGMTQHKMDAIAALCRSNRITVYLLTYVNGDKGPEDFSASSLIQLYRQIKASLPCEVSYAVINGADRNRAVLRFAEENKADLLLLNTGPETRIGWPSRYISDVIPPASRVQVLTV